MAERIAKVLQECGYFFYAPACSNQLFPIMPDEQIERLGDKIKFQFQTRTDEKHSVIRLVTSWATTEENVTELIRLIRNLK
jgi:threonine aldolase